MNFSSLSSVHLPVYNFRHTDLMKMENLRIRMNNFPFSGNTFQRLPIHSIDPIVVER